MKKILFFTSLIIIVASTFMTTIYYDSIKTDTSFIELNPIQEKITKKIIDNYFGKVENLRRESENLIKKIVLRDTDNNNWIDYLEYIEILIYPVDVISDAKEDLVICLNISNDTGIIAIYKIGQESYIYINKIEDLAYINSISVVRDRPNGNPFVIVEEVLDQRVGAYMIDHYIRIFHGNNSLKEVFRESMEYEAYYFEKWSDPSIENPKWFRITEENLIDYIANEEEGAIINTSKLLRLYEAVNDSTSSIPKDFKLINKSSHDVKYIWSNKYKYFIQSEGQLRSNNEAVGIIEKSEQIADNMLNLRNPYYKIIYSNGKIEYIPKAELIDVVPFTE